jgi:uncharacterized membrane protein
MNILLLALALGFASALRTMTPLAVVSLAAHLNWISLQGTPLAFVGSPVAVIIFGLGAFGELIVDKLPGTPERTAPFGLIARLCAGAFTGAVIAFAIQQSWWLCAAVGAIGALAGTFAGYETRRRLVHSLGIPDYVVAILEDILAVGGAFFLASHLK